jgi:SAM-dependent methyltransferase
MSEPEVADELFDPMVSAADVAWHAAPDHCGVDPLTGVCCDWYHGLWPYLRALGVNNTLARHAALFGETLKTLVDAGGHNRVLISGAADHLLAAIVLKAFRGGGPDLRLTVLDRCATPLMLSLWYAEQIGAELETVCSGLLEYRAEQSYDVICAHSFINFFDRRDWSAVVRSWRNALRPGGVLMMANSIRPSAPEGPTVFVANKANRLRRRVLEAARCLEGGPAIDAVALSRALDTYIENFTTTSVRSRKELTGLIEDGGLAIQQASFGPPGLEAAEHSPGREGEEREYAWIVARRE